MASSCASGEGGYAGAAHVVLSFHQEILVFPQPLSPHISSRKDLSQINAPHYGSFSVTNVPPTEQYVNQSSPIALQGNTHKLHCFFSG